MGSSPLTRGKPPVRVTINAAPGLIPAHAGKTPCVRTCASRLPAHPRSRGENRVDDADSLVEYGSSPLTRGKHMSVDRLRARRGLIPAHAGKT